MAVFEIGSAGSWGIEDSEQGAGMRDEPIKTAREEADGIIKGAQEKAALIEREAYESGYQQGEKTGIEIGEKRFESAVKSLERALAASGRSCKRIGGYGIRSYSTFFGRGPKSNSC